MCNPGILFLGKNHLTTRLYMEYLVIIGVTWVVTRSNVSGMHRHKFAWAHMSSVQNLSFHCRVIWPLDHTSFINSWSLNPYPVHHDFPLKTRDNCFDHQPSYISYPLLSTYIPISWWSNLPWNDGKIIYQHDGSAPASHCSSSISFDPRWRWNLDLRKEMML